MSLLEQASLCITPNAYKENILYSVIPNTTLGDMDVVRASTATRVNSAGLIENVALNIPRIDYTNGSCPSLLVEPQRSNLLIYSNDFTNPVYYSQDSTITTNFAISPDGTQNANKITATATDPVILQNVYSGLGTTYTMSIYAKGVGSTIGKTCRFFLIRDAFLELKTFDFVLTSEWQRFTATFTFTTAALTNVGYRVDLPNVAVSGDQVLVYGAQLEAGSYATSYIPTVASTVTRNADVLTVNLPNNNMNFTAYLELKEPTLGLLSGDWLKIFSNISESGRAFGYSNLIGFADNYIGAGSDITNGLKMIWRQESGSTARVFVNGNFGGFSNTGTYTNPFNRFLIDGTYLSKPAKINQFIFFDEILTDAECISLTTL